jgi:hypothetical protein
VLIRANQWPLLLFDGPMARSPDNPIFLYFEIYLSDSSRFLIFDFRNCFIPAILEKKGRGWGYPKPLVPADLRALQRKAYD